MKQSVSQSAAAADRDTPGDQAALDAAIRALVERCAVGLCLVEPSGWNIVYANATLRTWLAASADSSGAANLADWLPPTEVDDLREQIDSVAAGELAETTFPGQLAMESGNQADVQCIARRIDVDGGRVLLAITVQLVPLPATAAGDQTDPLTGLADRAFLMERLSALVEGDRCGDQQCAVLFIDVDGFKQVNDAHGHLVGDQVLREVARRLAGCVRADDHVVRFGGDEFVVLLEHVGGRGEIQPVVDRINTAFARPVALPRGSVMLTVSVGVARAEPHGQTAEQLLDAADRAMYAAKHAAI